MPAGVLTKPTCPVSVCFRSSQDSGNTRLIEELQAKVSAELAFALAIVDRTGCRRQPQEHQCLQAY